MPVFHSTRAYLVALSALVTLGASSGRASAQNASPSNFTIYVRGAAVGSEQVSVERTADGWTITSGGRIGAPVNLIIREFKARYDASWKPVDLSIDATIGGQPSTLRTTVSDTTATTELTGAPGAEPLRRTDTIDPQAIFLPNPFIAAYEAVAARTVTAAAGSSLFLYQPGQGSFSAIVGESMTERIRTVARVINARHTRLTFQAASLPPTET